MKIYYTQQERTILRNLMTKVIDLRSIDRKDQRKYKSMVNKLESTGASVSLKEAEVRLIANVLHQILEAREFKSKEQEDEFNSLPDHEKEYHSSYNTLILVLLEKLKNKLNLGKDNV